MIVSERAAARTTFASRCCPVLPATRLGYPFWHSVYYFDNLYLKLNRLRRHLGFWPSVRPSVAALTVQQPVYGQKAVGCNGSPPLNSPDRPHVKNVRAYRKYFQLSQQPQTALSNEAKGARCRVRSHNECAVDPVLNSFFCATITSQHECTLANLGSQF